MERQEDKSRRTVVCRCRGAARVSHLEFSESVVFSVGCASSRCVGGELRLTCLGLAVP